MKLFKRPFRTSPPVLALALASCFALQAETPPELRAMVKKSLAGLNQEEKVKADWLFVSRDWRKEFHADGKLKSEKSWAVRREFVDGVTIGRTFERDGKPLTPEETAKQDAAIHKAVAEWKALSEDEKRKRREASKKKDSGEDAWIQEFPEALDYKVVGEETLNGRPAAIVEFQPRAGYEPKNMRGRVFEKMRGKLWIDKADHEMTRADAEVFDTVSIGFGFLGKIEKGTKFYLERRQIAPGVWLKETEQMRFDARVLLVKTMRQEIIKRYSGWTPKARVQAQAQAQPAATARPPASSPR